MRFYSKKTFSLVALVLAFSVTQTSYAMRCGTKLVHSGKNADTQNQVRKKCGNPTEQYTQKIPVYNKKGKQIGTKKRQVWEYDRSPLGFIYIITFENGKVLDISGGRE